MRNILFILFSSMLFQQTARAEKADSLVIYMKNSGMKVGTKDSADFVRVIMPPDSSVDRDLYRVIEYYPNGKRRSVASSFTNTDRLILDGACIEYFPNGKRRSSSLYKKGVLTGEMFNYYPSGKLYSHLKIVDMPGYYYYGSGNYNPSYYSDSYKIQVIEMRDALGKLLVTNGKGHVIVYDDNFEIIEDEGDIVNDKKEGEWSGQIADTANFVITYHKDVLKKGITHTRSGKQYTFTKIEVEPVFSDGREALVTFLKKNTQYPESARKRNIQGYVGVEFTVEPNGTVSNPKVTGSLMKSADDEALRVVGISPLWIPGTIYGIPVPMEVKVEIGFYKNPR
ncbi:MAG TPA: TonB family protein [Mucilaginibacter sp.]|jgi:TonB family protein